MASSSCRISYNHSSWETLLKTIDGTLPWPSAQGSKICYYFDLSQACSAQAVENLLGLASAVDLAVWSTSVPDEDCNTLLDKQRIFFESVASSLFASAITKAATAGVTNFELLAQSWVLRFGHYALTTNQQAFVTMIKGIIDWTTVHCDSTSLFHDGLTTARTTLIGDADCDILDNAYVAPINCDSAGCSYADGVACCIRDFATSCCSTHLTSFTGDCSLPFCSLQTSCCSFDPTSLCCTS